MTLDEQEFQRRTQQIALGLQNVVERINTLRQTARSRAQLFREVVIKPTTDGWRETRPIGLGILRGPPQSEEAQKVIKQAEPKPVEPRPIFPILADILKTEPKPEAPPVEVEPPKPAESEPRWSRYKSPDQPALL
jgi:hypothetical protein